MSTRTRYRSSTVHISVDLDEFDEDQIVDYLRDQGYHVGKAAHSGGPEPGEALVLEEEVLDRISTLVLCGQKKHAAEYLLQVVGAHIGRSLL